MEAAEVMKIVFLMTPEPLAPIERLFLLIPAWHSTSVGHNAYPSVTRLARQTSLSPRSVLRALRSHMDKRFIVATGITSRSVVRYTVDLETCDRAAQVETSTCDSQSHVDPPDTNRLVPGSHVTGATECMLPSARQSPDQCHTVTRSVIELSS